MNEMLVIGMQVLLNIHRVSERIYNKYDRR